MTFAQELAAFRAENPDIETAEIFIIDLNGMARGKVVPIDHLEKLATGGMKMPTSSYTLDIFSLDNAEAEVALERGDPDGVLVPVPGTLARLSWSDRPVAQVQAQITEADGSTSCAYDPRAVLERVTQRVNARGVRPVIALELEFYLVDPSLPCPPKNPVTGERLAEAQIYVMDVSSAFAPILDEIGTAARALGAPAETVIAEFGPGQFEMNLGHVDCPLKAADQMVALKRAVRGVARAHGMDATFMPKPYGEQSGSGMHIHMSLLDEAGQNVFSTEEGVADTTRHAVAGLLQTMPDFMLVFSPNANGYRRLAPGSFAPIVAAWGLDNRGTAVRLPATSGMGARIEHRTSGSDVNPYLLTAAILAGALEGIERKLEPPQPVIGEAGPQDGETLPLSWWAAERKFAESPVVRDWLGEECQRIFASQKRQERSQLISRVPDTEYALYLRSF
ncbi:glutamine synthetase [Rhodobacteraceae bacterium NNCM2]|nr:glutamine synthetase [Coraliihabitans acroporae]